VGVNDFVVEDQPPVPLLRMDPEGRRRHLARLAQVRRERDQERAELAMEHLASACRSERTNTMPVLLEAVGAYCTLGEICGVMREVFGEHRETVVV